ncbi:MAG: hypothetical protein AB200_01925 [Parcubacteria bacterium C7867-005]|nr:MAG: hypothetical protein AB200_01925 [Parcubacteria bacterium C7867-005]
MPITEDHKENEGTAGVYEVGYLILPSVTEENLSKVVDKLVSVVEKAGATKLDSEEPHLEELAYSMSKSVGARKYVVDEAYIGWMKFEAESSQVEAIKIGVDKIEEVLRSLLIKTPRETTFTFEMAQKAREAREAALNAVLPELPGEPKADEDKAVEAPVADPVVE